METLTERRNNLRALQGIAEHRAISTAIVQTKFIAKPDA